MIVLFVSGCSGGSDDGGTSADSGLICPDAWGVYNNPDGSRVEIRSPCNLIITAPDGTQALGEVIDIGENRLVVDGIITTGPDAGQCGTVVYTFEGGIVRYSVQNVRNCQ